MSSFAPVCSLPIYRALHQMMDLGKYHLLIATEVVKDPNGWSSFWNDEILNGPVPVVTPFIIMDNGLIETGVPTDPMTLVHAASLVQAGCVVLPDVLGNMPKTIGLAHAASKEIGTRFPMLGVVQGQNMSEVSYCADAYKDWGVEYISIPRVMVDIFGSRLSLTAQLTNPQFGWKGVHLLGFSDNLEDDMQSAALAVMGIDSATPVWMGLFHHEFLPATPPRTANFGRRPEGYWERGLSVYEGYREVELIQRNIEKVRNWIRWGASSAIERLVKDVPSDQPLPSQEPAAQ